MTDTTAFQTGDPDVDLFFDNPTEPETETDEAPEDNAEAPMEAEAEDVTDDEDAAEVEAEDADDEDDESEDDDADDDDESEAPDIDMNTVFQVKHDGDKVVEKTLQELINEASGQASLNRRHQELKAQEQALTEAAQQMQQTQNAVLQLYQQAQQMGFQAPPTPPDISLMQTDPIGYIEQKEYYEQARQQWEYQNAQIQSVQQAQEQQQQLLRQQHIAAQQERLAEKFPEFKENKEAFGRRLMEGAKAHYGADPQAFNNITDAVAVEILADALAYRDLKAGKKAARKPERTAKGVTRPQAKSATAAGKKRSAKALERYRKTGSDDDLIDLFLS